MLRACLSLLLVLSCGPACWSSPYWVDWEGDDLPENQGWTRVWGNRDGLYQGPGAARTLDSGILTLDSLYDDGVFDSYKMSRPGETDPEAGETFDIQWRLKVDQVVGRADPAVGVYSDGAWGIGLEFAEDEIYSVFEAYATIPIAPHVWHTYELRSTDMRSYSLYLDDQLARQGHFTHVFTESYVGWGDAIQGAASRHEWDYVRFGAVVPEPSCLLLELPIVACIVCRRGKLGARS